MTADYSGPSRMAFVIPAALLTVVLLVIVIVNVGGSSTSEDGAHDHPHPHAEEQELLALPTELVEVDAGHSEDEHEHEHGDFHEHFDFQDENHLESMEQLAASLRTFEEGYRSILRGDTLESKQARVEAVVHPEVLPSLRLEPDAFVADMTYDIVARVDTAEDMLGGMLKHIATGEISLVVEVTFFRINAEGEEVEEGTILKRSRWERIDGQWLLMGADT